MPCHFFAPAAIVMLFFIIIIFVGESFCCHCLTLTEGTMGPDGWKKQINSRPILEFEVLPLWHERASFLESAYCLKNAARAGRWRRTHTNKQEKMFFILRCINSISMFIKALRNTMCDVKIAIFFFFFDMLPGSKLYPVEEIQYFFWCEDIAWKRFHMFKQINILACVLLCFA